MVYLPLSLSAQPGSLVKGKVINPFTKEAVAFATVKWKKNGTGTLTDSLGFFSVRLSNMSNDSLIIGYVGHDNFSYAVKSVSNDTLQFLLGPLKQTNEVFVKSKFSKGLRWWKNVVTHKPENNPYQYQSYSYTLYNKLEIDLNNINKEKFRDIKLLKPFGFVLDNIDSVTEAKPFLPVFLTETLSEYYFSNSPSATREVITAQQTHGLKNESVLQFINGVNQRINVYSNQLNIFDKEFISPLSNVGDKYYNYKGADTITIGSEKYFHLIFSPKFDGENTFSGDCWIHSTTWAIQRINLNINTTANINFVHRLSISQEFNRNENGKWLFAKDVFVAEVSPLKKDKFSFIGRKTKKYTNIKINAPEIEAEIKKNRIKDEVISNEASVIIDKKYWNEHRTEQLTKNEESVLKLIDTLKTVPVFKKYSETLAFIVDGHKKIGKFEIGPWFKWVSGNPIEQVRLRFDLGTTELFSKSIRLHAYVAYGFRDSRWKGKIDFNYKFPGNKGWSIFGAYIDDLDNGKIKYNDEDVTTDNVFSQLIRRPNIPQKFLGIEEHKLGFAKEWAGNFSITNFISRIEYNTYLPLPAVALFNNNPLVNTEIVSKLRYAPGEKSINTFRKKFRVRSDQPVYELRLGKSVPDIYNGEYNSFKATLSIKQQFRIPRFGQVSYFAYGGKIWAKDALPFVLLELHPGNEIYYYNKETFNLMNRFEYFSDRFAGINIEHNFEKKLINLVPFLRKTKVRQFWNLKTVWGNLDLKSRQLNRTDFGDYRLRSLRGDFYTEIGTGFDNLFRFFRIDLVWRINPFYARANPSLLSQNTNDFGVFGSFRIQF